MSEGLHTIEEMLEVLLPELDWSFMRGRLKTLSEKARENKLIEEGAYANGNQEAGVEAIEAIEER